TLQIIDEDPHFYARLESISAGLEKGIRDAMGELALTFAFNRFGSMFTLFFSESTVTDFDSAKTSDTTKFAAYFGEMLGHAIYLPPSQFEACFISIAHEKEDIDKTIGAIRRALGGIS